MTNPPASNRELQPRYAVQKGIGRNRNLLSAHTADNAINRSRTSTDVGLTWPWLAALAIPALLLREMVTWTRESLILGSFSS
jgi:hypothetical protein